MVKVSPFHSGISRINQLRLPTNPGWCGISSKTTNITETGQSAIAPMCFPSGVFHHKLLRSQSPSPAEFVNWLKQLSSSRFFFRSKPVFFFWVVVVSSSSKSTKKGTSPGSLWSYFTNPMQSNKFCCYTPLNSHISRKFQWLEDDMSFCQAFRVLWHQQPFHPFHGSALGSSWSLLPSLLFWRKSSKAVRVAFTRVTNGRPPGWWKSS